MPVETHQNAGLSLAHMERFHKTPPLCGKKTCISECLPMHKTFYHALIAAQLANMLVSTHLLMAYSGRRCSEPGS